MPQNPTRQVHALLGGFVQDALINNQNHNQKTDKIIARTLFFSKNQKNCDLKKRLLKKDSAKQTRTQILKNSTLPKNDNANETDKILQTQLTRNFAKRKRADFENLQNQPRTKPKPRNKANQNLRWPKPKPKNLDANFCDSMKPNRNFADKRKFVEQKPRTCPQGGCAKTCLQNKDSNSD